MKLTLKPNSLSKILSDLATSNKKLKKIYPGEGSDRQPVQTVYGGAQLFKRNTTKRIGELAAKSFEEYLPNHNALREVFGITDESLAKTVHEKVKNKLQAEAVEDFRIDFEDGFGFRPDEEEDRTAEFAALETAAAMNESLLPPFIGIRVKTLTEESKRRTLRTLDIYMTTLTEISKGKLPDNFVVTLPKVASASQVDSLVSIFKILEKKLKLEKGSLKMELMIETPQSIFDSNGNANLLPLVIASKGRCKAAHFGVYDYTASCEVTAKLQTMRHPVCDFARNMMKVCLAGTGVWLSDGATNILPVGPHRGENLSGEQRIENINAIHNAWKTSYDDIMHSLRSAFYQGWDLHPAQIPVRYIAVYSFFLSGLEQASGRLKNFIDKAAQATLAGDIFDDVATGQGLLNYFLRALNCGAITEKDVTETGLSIDEIRLKSFLKIMERRK